MEDFDTLCERMAKKIKNHSFTQRVPGLDQADIESHLNECLWKAWNTYDPTSGLIIEQWWWSIWMNRKADLIEAFFAKKRPPSVPMDPTLLAEGLHPLVTLDDLLAECPDEDSLARAVWLLIICGYGAGEIRRALNMSLRAYYRIIHRWRTQEVWTALT